MMEELNKTGKLKTTMLRVSCGVGLFFIYQYVVSLIRLSGGSGSMKNKFSALAQDQYMDFLVAQNLYVLLGYGLLSLFFVLVLSPLVDGVFRKKSVRSLRMDVSLALLGSFLLHGFFVMRLVKTRPYFLDDAKFGHWYFEALNIVPDAAKPVVFFLIFTALPLAVLGYALWWYGKHFSLRGRVAMVAVLVALISSVVWKCCLPSKRSQQVVRSDEARRWNVIIIGSDSLRGDKLGYAGYRPRRNDGAAAAGVSPNIDAIAKESINLSHCYTPIASTLESGTSLMSSQYPHTHGFRQMYPSEETVRTAKAVITPMAEVLRKTGYDTAAIGDWCAGYYELMPLGFEHVSVSSFDNFKIYMSQAVVLAHFVIPLYFDHEIGYEIFPQLQSFAQFVTPKVVTNRVKDRLNRVAQSGEPFFWHVFYSCNHLPYRNPEPYSSMFTDPDYSGPNKNGVAFDIDEFIGGTDLEDKWQALPEKEIRQIRDLYDGCTRMFDDHVGEILDELERSGLDKNTIVIVTSDHGDNLYEEGVTLGHGLTFNGGLQANHIPMLIRLPGAIAKTIPEQINMIDLMPTLADLLEVEKPENWEGKSYAKWLDGSETPKHRAFYGETGFPFIQFRVKGIERPKLPPMDRMTRIDDSFNYQFVLRQEFEKPLVETKQRCLVSAKWMLICTPTNEGKRHFGLFSREGTGFGLEDVSTQQPEVVEAMRIALEKWMDERVETSLEEVFPSGE
jgi:arylsulfatase A-like enzyme